MIQQNMRRIAKKKTVAMIALAAVLASAAAGWSQQYFEASGRSAAFTLTPGAKAGPDAIRSNVSAQSTMGRSINVVVVKGSLVITPSPLLHGPIDLAIFDVAGRLLYRQHSLAGQQVRIDLRRFATGIYHARLHCDGIDVSRRFSVGR